VSVRYYLTKYHLSVYYKKGVVNLLINDTLRAKADRVEMTPFEFVRNSGKIEQERQQGERRIDNRHLYYKDVVTLKRYGNRLKLTMCKSMRKKGYEGGEKMARGTANSEKLANNISRARNKVFEYAMCNEWEHFVTLTIDPNKYDRTNLKKYYKDLGEFITNENRKLEKKIKYVLIPELHENGAWHMHGVMMGIPSEQLKKNKHGYLDWERYRNKFGYISIDPIRDKQKCASYLTKYVTKEMSNTISELNAKSYYCSKGLKVAEEIKKGRLCESLQDLEYDFQNDYVKIKWFDDDISISDFIEEMQ
jgi:hypothetical protein